MSNDWLNVDIDSDDDAYPEDDPYETPYGMEFNAGREYEREAIVEWLRQGGSKNGVTRYERASNIADRIERGEHLRGDDERA